MKVLFLDFDGVLNDKNTTNTYVNHLGIDKEKVLLIEDILTKSQAKLVISSSWRNAYAKNVLQEYLSSFGLTHQILDYTPSRNRGLSGSFFMTERSEEIKEWLQEHPETTNFVVIDDLYLPSFTGNYIETNEEVGLTKEQAQQAVDILNS